MALTWHEWLRRLRHDLVKRILWPARDRRDMGGPVLPGELVAVLADDEGATATAESIWGEMREAAPEPAHPALQAFEAALLQATAAARRNDLPGVLALEIADARLATDLAGKES
jgi:hypothetical protein